MTYEYECKACNTIFEVQKRISDPVDCICPECGSDLTKRLISATNFVLKGSVWSRDGYHSNLREEIKNLPQSDEDD